MFRDSPNLSFEFRATEYCGRIYYKSVFHVPIYDPGANVCSMLIGSSISISVTHIPRAVASAVIVPESSEQPHSPPEPAKRRKSPISEQSPKRARLSHGESSHGQGPMSAPPARVDRALERRKSGQMEERKRGQRLFGALLGTLSQSSSSTAHKRRTDIERKQQAKLKLQADEFDEKKKQRLDAIMEVRRQEQKKYDKQSVSSAFFAFTSSPWIDVQIRCRFVIRIS